MQCSASKNFGGGVGKNLPSTDGGGGVNGNFTYAQANAAEYAISSVHQAETLQSRTQADSDARNGNDDEGRGITYYCGCKNQGDPFYFTVFIDGKLRCLNKASIGGSSIIFHADGTMTQRDEMNFDGNHEHAAFGNWNKIIPCALVN